MTHAPKPLVTLGIPSFNSGEFLKWTLESVVQQTMEDFECIVVDDCSTDGSTRYFSEVVGKDPRFKLIKHKVNSGLPTSRNTVIGSAQGKFTAFLDSDDLISSNSLETRAATCLWAERTSDRFAGSYSASATIEEGLRHAPEPVPQDLPFIDWISADGQCPFNANQPMLRTDILRRAGGFNEYMTQSEDYDLWLRILRAGYSFAPAKWRNITYRKRQGSMIRKEPLKHLSFALSLLNSSSSALGSAVLNWSETRFTSPIHTYRAQRLKLNRIFEFCGMELARESDTGLEAIVDLVRLELPNLNAAAPTNFDFATALRRGVERQIGQPKPEHLMQIENLTEIFKESDVKRVTTHHQKTMQSGPYGNPKIDLPWDTAFQKSVEVAFIPHSAYHVWTISLLKEKLEQKGIKFVVVDISPQWREGGVRAAAAKYDLPLIGLSTFATGQFAWRNIVVFNDWDPVTRPILVAAQASGIATTAIVEGIQDYDDADVHWIRHAYKTADTVLLPGDFDAKYFRDKKPDCIVTGVPRIQTLRSNPKRKTRNAKKARVLINANFSYGVLEEHRDAWLDDAVQTVLDAGLTPIISRHPGDRGQTHNEYVTDQSFYEVLETCEVSIQRFASGVLEALARDVGVIYYNPHGEKVDKFQLDPMGAYPVVYDKQDLRSQLAQWKSLREMAMTKSGAFLNHHCGHEDIDVLDATANGVIAAMGAVPNDDACELFKSYLAAIAQRTKSMTECVLPDGPLFPDPKLAIAKLDSFLKADKAQAKVKKAQAKVKKVQLRSKAPETPKNGTAKAVLDAKLVMDTVPARKSPKTDQAVLRSVASELLLKPDQALQDIAQPARAADIQAAVTKLGAQDPAVVHFQKVKAFAERKTGT